LSTTRPADRPLYSPAEALRLIDGGQVPDELTCYELSLEGREIIGLPARMRVEFKLNLRNCTKLESLPVGLKVGSLDISGCTSLAALPEGLDVYFLDMSDCPQIRAWPQVGTINVGRLRARNCTGLTRLPPWIHRLSQLDLAGCSNLTELPDGLRISSWLDLADTAVTSLPPSLQGTPLRWRGVPVEEHVVFRPEEITADEVLAEVNAEVRRVKLERMGFDRFLSEAEAEVVDSDTDPGGPRKLLRVNLEGDEPLVCVSVLCPSTGRHYIIRVPPDMQTCRQAVAWTAGFDNPDHYQPVAET
jgi:hypothetical protein